MSSRQLETGIATLNFARRMTLGLLDGTPQHLWFHIPIPEGNHAAWIAGHIAWEDDSLLNDLIEARGSKLPQQWHDCFAQGTKPVSEADRYPAIPEIRETLAARREEFIGFFTASAARLADPLPDQWHSYAKDLAALMPAVACHEMLHVGQLTVIRKHLKLPPVFG